MKKIILQIGISFLLLFVMGGGCEKDSENEVISLEYVKCPCEQARNYIGEVNYKDVLLFDASKTSFEEMKEFSFDGERHLFASYSSVNNSLTLYTIRTTMMGIGRVCNVPQKAINWDTSLSGDYISFSADEFESCDSQGSIAANTYADYVLKSLKRRVK